jgi:hypothetical protein
MAKRRWYCPWIFLATTFIFFLYILRPDEPRLFTTRLNQVSLGVEQRVMWWDWKDTNEEVWCRMPYNSPDSKDPVPYVVHYILLGKNGRMAEMCYPAFLSIKATIIRMNPTVVKLHTYGLDTSNPWWKLLEHRVTLVEYDRHTLNGPHGRHVDEFSLAHQADFLRLSILMREGGIYLDTDVYPLKSFTDLLNNPRDIVMGHEGGNRYGLCNAIVIARAGSQFLQKWIRSYSTFNRRIWNYHSVRMPKMLQVQYPDLICPLSPTVFFWPTWSGKHRRYMQMPINQEDAMELQHNMSAYGGAMYENQLAIHGSAEDLTPEKVLTEDTRFNILMRDLVNAPISS